MLASFRREEGWPSLYDRYRKVRPPSRLDRRQHGPDVRRLAATIGYDRGASVAAAVTNGTCESLRAVLGIAVRLRRRHLGMTRNGSGTQRVALVTSRLPSAGVGLAPPLLA
jgi:hypothetical protein